MKYYSFDILFRLFFCIFIGLYHIRTDLNDLFFFINGYLFVDFFFITSGFYSNKIINFSLFKRYGLLILINFGLNVMLLLYYKLNSIDFKSIDFIANTLGLSSIYSSFTKFNYVSWYLGVDYFLFFLTYLFFKFNKYYKIILLFVNIFIIIVLKYNIDYIILIDNFDFTYGISAFIRGSICYFLGVNLRNIYTFQINKIYYFITVSILLYLSLVIANTSPINIYIYMLFLSICLFIIYLSNCLGVFFSSKKGIFLILSASIFFLVHPLSIKINSILFDNHENYLYLLSFLIISFIINIIILRIYNHVSR